jgi:hypothetical protein
VDIHHTCLFLLASHNASFTTALARAAAFSSAVKLPLTKCHSSAAAAASRALSEAEGGSETKSKNEGP